MHTTARMEVANEPTITAQASAPDRIFGSRFPKKALIRKPANGSSGIRSNITASNDHGPTASAQRHQDTKAQKQILFESLCLAAFVYLPRARSSPDPYHLSKVNASGLNVSRCRKMAMTSARPTAASAAATVMTKNTMICPSTMLLY